MVGNLVDSNVLLRSVMLSLQQFATEDNGGGALSPRMSLLLGFYSSPYKLGPFLKSNWWALESAPSKTRELPSECSRADALVTEPTRRRQLLWDLISTVDRVVDINQENICVVNTALIFLVYCRREGCLQAVLTELRLKERETAAGDKMDSFVALLQFWRVYYCNHRRRDCESLEFSSGIPFHEWTAVVEELQPCVHNDGS